MQVLTDVVLILENVVLIYSLGRKGLKIFLVDIFVDVDKKMITGVAKQSVQT